MDEDDEAQAENYGWNHFREPEKGVGIKCREQS
jgi:hypothetical protein